MIEIEKIQLASTENDALVRTRVIIGREMVGLQQGANCIKLTVPLVLVREWIY